MYSKGVFSNPEVGLYLVLDYSQRSCQKGSQQCCTFIESMHRQAVQDTAVGRNSCCAVICEFPLKMVHIMVLSPVHHWLKNFTTYFPPGSLVLSIIFKCIK